MALDSTGRAHWEGDLTSGSGTATLDTGACGPLQVTWKARSETHEGLTSPEELLAAAHAACFSMAFSGRLGKAGGTSIVLDTEATATFVPGEGITGIRLTVSGSADGVERGAFPEPGGRREGQLPGVEGLHCRRSDNARSLRGLTFQRRRNVTRGMKNHAHAIRAVSAIVAPMAKLSVRVRLEIRKTAAARAMAKTMVPAIVRLTAI